MTQTPLTRRQIQDKLKISEKTFFRYVKQGKIVPTSVTPLPAPTYYLVED